jgi:hypothetical protein
MSVRSGSKRDTPARARREVACPLVDGVGDVADAIADADDEQRGQMARELHEADRVDGAAELAVSVGEVQDRGGVDTFRPAMTDEDLELGTDVLRVEVVDLGPAERRRVGIHGAAPDQLLRMYSESVYERIVAGSKSNFVLSSMIRMRSPRSEPSGEPKNVGRSVRCSALGHASATIAL